MYIEFSEDEKVKLNEVGYIENRGHKFIYQDNEFDTLHELTKRPDGSVDMRIIFADGDEETIPFPSFDALCGIISADVDKCNNCGSCHGCEPNEDED
jgi:hypothetical protein